MAEGYHDWAIGEEVTAANLEDYCQNQGIMRFASASARDTALSAVKTEGMFAYLKDLNVVTVYTGSAWSTLGPLHGALTSWTPTITQSGSVSFTNSYSRYQRIGRKCELWGFGTITGSGTGSNDITVGNLPFTAAINGIPIGEGLIFDGSASANFPALIYLASTTTLKFVSSATNVGTGFLGSSTMTAGLANGDYVQFHGSYEVASDA